MALRLRRGTNAERQLITPAQGELIYTTDTKALYIGDGTTAGGIIVQGAGGGASSLNDLTDVNVGSVADGQVLTYSTSSSKWQPQNGAGIALGRADTLTDISYGADNTAYWGDMLLHDGNSFIANSFVGGNHQISIVGNDSTVIVNHNTGDLSGDLISGDIKGGNLIGGDMIASSDNSIIIDSNIKTANGLTLKANDGTVAYDPATRLFTGDVVGNVQGDIYATDMTKVFDKASGQWLGDIQGDIYAGDSTKVFNSIDSKFTGNFDGAFVGIHSGSVFAEDSTLLVDGINGKLVGTVETSSVLAGNIKLTTATSKNTMFLQQNAESNYLTITTEATAGTIVLSRNTQFGSTNAAVPSTYVTNYNDAAFIGEMHMRTANSNNTAASGGGMGVLRARGTKAAPLVVQTGDQIGGFYSAAYNGSAYKPSGGLRMLVAGTPTANYIPSNVELYNSDTAGNQQAVLSIAQTDSVASFSGAIKLKVVADDTARAAAVTAPVAGMIIFNSTGTKFQGYTGSAWVDLN